MAETLTVRGVNIGAGTPGIIASIANETEPEIINQARLMLELPVDIVEWRADHFAQADDIGQVLHTLSALRRVLGDKPLLFTFRSKPEGGARDMARSAYTQMNLAVADSGAADLVDVEILSGDDITRRNIDAIHAAGAYVIGSSHDFAATPPREEIIRRLRKSQDMGADIAKIAVMPQSTADVLSLLAATQEMRENYADIPLIAIAMSGQGLISRLAGELFGSALTFGAVGKASAPGQIQVAELAGILQVIHTYC